jgi:head-tail adaptor
MIRAGQLTRLVQIVAPTYAQDEFGEQQIDWASPSLVAETYANVEPLGGRELELARGFATTVSHKITIDYIPNLDATMRLLFTPHTGPQVYYNINAITDPTGQDRWRVLYCTEEYL